MEWLQPDVLRLKDAQWKGSKVAQIICIEIPKAGKKGK